MKVGNDMIIEKHGKVSNFIHAFVYTKFLIYIIIAIVTEKFQR